MSLPLINPIIPNELDFGKDNYRQFNRGSKLHPRLPHQNLPENILHLQTKDPDSRLKVVHFGKRKAISLISDVERFYSSKLAYDLYEDEGPYSEIDVEDIWAQSDDPKTIKTNKTIMHTLSKDDLLLAASSASEMIDEISSLHQSLEKLTEMLMFDMPEGLDEDVSPDVLFGIRKLCLDNAGCWEETLRVLRNTRLDTLNAHQKKRRFYNDIKTQI